MALADHFVEWFIEGKYAKKQRSLLPETIEDYCKRRGPHGKLKTATCHAAGHDRAGEVAEVEQGVAADEPRARRSVLPPRDAVA